MVRAYYPEPIAKVTTKKTPEETAGGVKLITGLLTNVHICATAEAVAFARYLKVDLDQFYELVNDAAGGSQMFRVRGAAMIKSLKDGSEIQGNKSLNDGVKELSNVVQEAKNVNCPVYLASEALNQLLFAQRRGWGKAADAKVVNVWEV
jgi:3-hydroxyisobutyrate dehydrogenase